MVEIRGAAASAWATVAFPSDVGAQVVWSSTADLDFTCFSNGSTKQSANSVPAQLCRSGEDHPRTPIAAVGVTIVYERLLASPITNRHVPCARLRTIVPAFFGPA